MLKVGEEPLEVGFQTTKDPERESEVCASSKDITIMKINKYR